MFLHVWRYYVGWFRPQNFFLLFHLTYSICCCIVFTIRDPPEKHPSSKRTRKMNTFVDCPKCGSEFIIDENILSSTLRCPDCLQWIDSLYSDDRAYVSSYSSRGADLFDEYGYESGYDYWSPTVCRIMSWMFKGDPRSRTYLDPRTRPNI